MIMIKAIPFYRTSRPKGQLSKPLVLGRLHLAYIRWRNPPVEFASNEIRLSQYCSGETSPCIFIRSWAWDGIEGKPGICTRLVWSETGKEFEDRIKREATHGNQV